jgi:single-strand DNA-binding protein
MDEWDGPDGPRTSFVLEARNLGPDLSRGVARFVPVVHRAAAGQGTEPARHPGGAQVPGEEVSGEQLSGAVEIEDPWAQDVAGLAGLAGDEDDEPGAGSASSDDEAPGDGAGDRSTSRAGREAVGATA